MKQFKNILVGIDLSYGDRFVGKELSAPNAEALRRALWLAKLNQAKVVLFCSLDLCPKTQTLLENDHGGGANVLDDAKHALQNLEVQAQADGVDVESKVVIGKSWQELIRQVISGQHDILVVGSRHLGPVEGFLLGSTGQKLLRNCPCPVWVTAPLTDKTFNSIVVAHDLRPVGSLALELGGSVAQLDNAKVHVVHCVEGSAAGSDTPDSAAQESARSRIAEQISTLQLTDFTNISISNDQPHLAIVDAIDIHRADLLVIGTVGRSGVEGLVTGNTAEYLLPKVPCSVLAVKPPRFVSPVT